MLKNILNTDPFKRYTIGDIRKHVWYNQTREVKQDGIIVGFNTVPIDRDILMQLETYGFNLD